MVLEVNGEQVQAPYVLDHEQIRQGAMLGLGRAVLLCLCQREYGGTQRVIGRSRFVWCQQAQVQTQAHFAQAERWNISSFPVLLVVKGEELSLLSSGYTKTATLVEHLKKILA